MSITYPYDDSGVKAENLVKGELHSVNESHFRDYFFLVPNFAPFYVDNFKASIAINGETRVLVEDVDYSFALSYVTGTRTTGKQLYGAITLHNLRLNGIITIEYQTIGGKYMADRLQVLTNLADKAYNPRTTIWELVTDVPDALPPTPHYQDYDTFFGQDKVVDGLHGIVEAIANSSNLTRETIAEFMTSIGIDTLDNYVRIAGDRMTGPLFLQSEPEAPDEATTKSYVDVNYLSKEAYHSESSLFLKQEDLNENLDGKLSVSGGTMSGFLTLNAAPVNDLHATTKYYVDNRLEQALERIRELEDQVNNSSSSSVTRDEVEAMIGEVLLRVLHKTVK